MSELRLIEYENLSKSNATFLEGMVQAATRVIQSGWYVLGAEVLAFEQEFAIYTGSRHCISVANGLDALFLTIEALELPPGSDILVASNTYIATILAIVRAGHRPVLVEPDKLTYNINPHLLKAALTPHSRAICVTHLFGKVCRMDDIMAVAKEYGLRIVEDCAQSHGARLGGRMTGTFGDAGCFSFYPTKNLGAVGDAGAICTDDDALAERLRHLRNYGSKVKYVNHFLGVNSRLDEIQAAMLRMKLPHLEAITEHKRRLAEVYFSNLPDWVETPVRRSDEFDVFHIFAIRHPQRDALRAWLQENKVKTEVHYPIPPHRQVAMAGILSGDYPIADELHKTELSLPISFYHSEEDVIEVCQRLARFPQRRTKHD